MRFFFFLLTAAFFLGGCGTEPNIHNTLGGKMMKRQTAYTTYAGNSPTNIFYSTEIAGGTVFAGSQQGLLRLSGDSLQPVEMEGLQTGENVRVFGLHAVVYSGLGEVRKYPFWIAKLRDYSMYLTLLSMPFPILNGLPAVLLIGGGIFCSWRKTAEYAEFVFYPLTVLACLFSTVYNIAANDSGRLIHQSLLDHLPLIAPCVFSLVLLFRESGRDVRFLAWCAAGVVLATPLLLNEEHVGIFWGGRHFITVIPVICVLTVHLLASGKLSRMAKYGTAALIFASVAANAAGYGFLLCKKTFSQDLVRTLNNPEVKTIVTDVFWLPEELAWLPRDKRIIFMTKAESSERVEALCRANGIAEFHTVLGLYFRVLSNDSVARVFETNRTLPGRLFRNDRLKLFTVQIFRTVLSEPVSGKDKQAKKD